MRQPREPEAFSKASVSERGTEAREGEVPTEKDEGCRAWHDVMVLSLNRYSAWCNCERYRSPAGEGSGEAQNKLLPGGIVLEKLFESGDQTLESNLITIVPFEVSRGVLDLRSLVAGRRPSVTREKISRVPDASVPRPLSIDRARRGEPC